MKSYSKPKVLELARGEWIDQHFNCCLIGNAGTGKTHLAIALGVAGCRQGRRLRFFTAAGLVNQLEEAQKGYRLERPPRRQSRRRQGELTPYAARHGGLYCGPGESELRAEVGPFCSPITKAAGWHTSRAWLRPMRTWGFGLFGWVDWRRRT